MLTFFVVHPLLMRKLTVIVFFQFAFFSCAFSQITASYNTVEEGEGLSRILLRATPDFKESSKIKLQWESPVLQEDHYFRVEKSRTGKDFELMAVIKGKAGQSAFEFTDEKPGSSSNFYRVKSSSNRGDEMSSEVISTGVSPIKFCSYYPNPVERFLIMRTESRVELTISDAQGNIRINKRFEPGVAVLDVSVLEKGFYIMRLYQKESNRVIIDKLLRN